jgi:transposase
VAQSPTVASRANRSRTPPRPPFDWQVARLAAYRGVTRLGALTLAAEVADWRRFASANAFMGFCGLVPSEYSSGNRVHRGRLTKAGNAHLRAQGPGSWDP